MKLLKSQFITKSFHKDLSKYYIKSLKSDVAAIPNTAYKFSVIKTDKPDEVSKLEQVLHRCLAIYENFVTEEEESYFVKEVSLSFRRKKYEYGHWDGVCFILLCKFLVL